MPNASNTSEQTDSRPRVCMFVYNNFTNDSRVQKEAETLIQGGYEVTVLALLDARTEPHENRNGINIARIGVNPWHLRLTRLFQAAEQPSPDLNGTKTRLPSNNTFHDTQKKPSAPYFFIKDRLTYIPRWIAKRDFKGYFSHFSLTIAYILLAIGLVRLLYSPELHAVIEQNEVVIYSILALLIVFRNPLVSFLRRAKRFMVNTFRRAKRFMVNTLKNCLMPFHRHFCFLSFYRNAYPATAGQGYAVYHAHDLNTLPVAWLAARRDRAGLVYDSHELYIERNKLKPSSRLWKFIQRRMEGFLVRRCDAVFTVNESLADELARRYKIPRPGVIMNTPARFEKADLHLLGNSRLRSELSIPRDKNILLYVGGITFNRGLEELIESLTHLPDCCLIYMGYGTDAYKQSLVELAEKIGVRDRFAFFGPVPSNRVIHYAAGADVGVAPIANACLSYYYCSPNKLFEYMNAGLPVIASNFPELEKVVLGHHIGLTFDPADPQDIARTARQILDNPQLADTMRKNALEASGQYNWGNEARKLLAIYKQCE